MATSTLTGAVTAPPRMVAMVNTLYVNHIAVSAPLVEAGIAAGYALVGPRRAEFGPGGELWGIGGIEFFPVTG